MQDLGIVIDSIDRLMADNMEIESDLDKAVDLLMEKLAAGEIYSCTKGMPIMSVRLKSDSFDHSNLQGKINIITKLYSVIESGLKERLYEHLCNFKIFNIVNTSKNTISARYFICHHVTL